MKLTWSHAVLNVRDLDRMLEFYTGVLGFTISDRGPLGPGAPEIVFMSNDPTEHHQIAMVPMREGETAGNPLNHLAFRVEHFADVSAVHERLDDLSVDILPLSHGNTLSLYFDDPEGNGLEVFWDTPWHVQQPQGKVWEPTLDESAALAWVEEAFAGEPGFAAEGRSDAEFVNRRD
nr:catechol 2,3-dioxygenase [uncultured bacterium]BAH90536.1 catechol 2,3-dioxygenase [uncultured bacterium]